MVFSFGLTLVERGWSITTAGSAISIVLWLAALSGIAGGFLADCLPVRYYCRDTTGLLRRDRRPRESTHSKRPPITHH